MGTYSVSLPPDVRRFTLAVDPRQSLVPRRIDVRLFLRPSRPVSVKMHFSDREVVTYQTFAARLARHCNNGQYDACLTYTEYAAGQVEGSSFIDRLWVRAMFNHALALREACERLGYDTCEKAAARYARLIEVLPQHPRVFTDEGLSLDLLTTAKAASERIPIQLQYGAIQAYYAAQLYSDAAQTAEAALQTVEAEGLDLTGTGITTDRLRVDAASAWALQGDAILRSPDTRKEAAIETYRRALEHLTLVKQKTSPIGRDVSSISNKLAVLER
jgi:tetratricopeptide (TPR) repeat protein